MLEQHGFRLPGVEVTFEEYGFDRWVDEVSIPVHDCLLKSGRIQGQLLFGGDDIADLETIVIPGQRMTVWDDGSVTYYAYVGTNWQADRQRFLHKPLTHSKWNRQPRMFLRYSGALTPDGGAGGRLNPSLVADTNLGYDYGPEGDEPRVCETSAVLTALTTFLSGTVLPYLREQAEKKAYPG
jgi:hypothetical protein